MLRRPFVRSFFLIACASLFFAGCGDDPANGDGTNNGNGGNGGSDTGTSSVTVSGALESTHTGIAEYELSEGETVASWRLYMHDVAPQQTFAMVISTVGMPPSEGQAPTIARPTPGTYALGGDTYKDDVFDVQYTYFGDPEDEDPPTWRTDIQGEGEFIVTESTDEKLVGSFTLDIYHARADDRSKPDEDSKITIEGEVTAVPK